MKTKIDWNKDSQNNARISITDGVMTHYVSEDQLPEEFTLREIAKAYAAPYDHNGSNEWVVARIKDEEDGERHTFAFNAAGDFEWNTDREYRSY